MSNWRRHPHRGGGEHPKPITVSANALDRNTSSLAEQHVISCCAFSSVELRARNRSTHFASAKAGDGR